MRKNGSLDSSGFEHVFHGKKNGPFTSCMTMDCLYAVCYNEACFTMQTKGLNILVQPSLADS